MLYSTSQPSRCEPSGGSLVSSGGKCWFLQCTCHAALHFFFSVTPVSSWRRCYFRLCWDWLAQRCPCHSSAYDRDPDVAWFRSSSSNFTRRPRRLMYKSQWAGAPAQVMAKDLGPGLQNRALQGLSSFSSFKFI